MLFKIGVTLIILIGIFLFFLVDIDVHEDRRDYRRMIVEGTNELKMLMVRESQYKDQPPWAKVKNQALELEDDINQEISNQIDQEEAEIAHYLKSEGEQPVAEEKVVRDSGDDEKEFYYDNNVMEEQSMYEEENDDKSSDLRIDGKGLKSKLHLSVVVCENRAKEALVMLKSVAIMTKDAFLVFHIVADSDRKHILEQELESWPPSLKSRIAYHVYDVIAPQGSVTLSSWNKLYKPCAAQRLFLPDRLKSVDSVIYVDTDTVFLQSIQALWSHFSRFNTSQLVGLVREAEDGSAGWYNRFANHPYYGEFGVNSGVMLMNLTRIRKTDWLSVLQADYEKYRLAITWGDQDLINIYFSKKPEQLYLMSCEWNFRADHCMYTSTCKAAERDGVSLLHGSRGAFYSEKEPAFGAVHEAFDHVVLGVNDASGLVADMKRRLRAVTKATNCNQVAHLFLTHLVKLASLASPPQDSQVPQNSLQTKRTLVREVPYLNNNNIPVKNSGKLIFKQQVVKNVKLSNSVPGKRLEKLEIPGKKQEVHLNSVYKKNDMRVEEVDDKRVQEDQGVKELKIVLIGDEVKTKAVRENGAGPVRVENADGEGGGKKEVVLKDGFGSEEDLSEFDNNAQYEFDEDEEEEKKNA